MRNPSVTSLSLFTSTNKSDISVTERVHIKQNLRCLGTSDDAYACLGDFQNPDASFVQARIVTPRNFEIGYRDSEGHFYVSNRKDYSKFEIVDIFIAFFEGREDIIEALEWYVPNIESYDKKEIKIQKREYNLNLGGIEKYPILNSVQLRELLADLGLPNVSFAVLKENRGGRIIQACFVDDNHYCLEYVNEKKRYFKFKQHFDRLEILDLFVRFYKGDRRWVDDYKSNESIAEDMDDEEIDQTNSFYFFLFIFAALFHIFVLNYFGKIGAIVVIAGFCIFEFFYKVVKESPLYLRMFSFILFVDLAFSFLTLGRDSIYAFFILCLMSFVIKWRKRV